MLSNLYLCYELFQGLNFQLSAVLLSIGVYAYIENGESKCCYV